ncbi:hypothetical protein T4D_10352 [Trichinella pseudospiralis]|uniref:Uncharacterized protein n=1 Tax=Trichinella pseudospiralis TaxID=6337 RepID=A0A0V1F994_TRIPS|nr:hypothetical protein T4D_10352 [Trichinella pseudospiralis]
MACFGKSVLSLYLSFQAQVLIVFCAIGAGFGRACYLSMLRQCDETMQKISKKRFILLLNMYLYVEAI